LTGDSTIRCVTTMIGHACEQVTGHHEVCPWNTYTTSTQYRDAALISVRHNRRKKWNHWKN